MIPKNLYLFCFKILRMSSFQIYIDFSKLFAKKIYLLQFVIHTFSRLLARNK